MNKMMTRVLIILMMFLMVFDAVGSENSMLVTTESTSTAVVMEAGMSAPQHRRKRRSRQRQSQSTRSRQRQSKSTRSRQRSQTTVAPMHKSDTVKTVETVKIEEQPTKPKQQLVFLEDLTTDYVVQDGCVISGIAGSCRLTIADKATVVLCGVDITNIPNRFTHAYAGITCAGDATIILAEGTTNKVMGGYENYPGIYVPEGKTLTIKGSGTLESSSQGWSAGIGGGKDLACGNIVIEEGTIIAEGGANAAAIGSGWLGSCGDIVIRPTVTRVTLIRKRGGGIAIGAGKDATCGRVTIADGAQVTEGDSILR